VERPSAAARSAELTQRPAWPVLRQRPCKPQNGQATDDGTPTLLLKYLDAAVQPRRSAASSFEVQDQGGRQLEQNTIAANMHCTHLIRARMNTDMDSEACSASSVEGRTLGNAGHETRRSSMLYHHLVWHYMARQVLRRALPADCLRRALRLRM